MSIAPFLCESFLYYYFRHFWYKHQLTALLDEGGGSSSLYEMDNNNLS